MNTLLQLLVSLISVILAAVVMVASGKLRDNANADVAKNARDAYNAGAGLLVFGLGALVMAFLAWRSDAKVSGYKQSLYDYLG